MRIKNIFIFICIAFFLASCSSSKNNVQKRGEAYNSEYSHKKGKVKATKNREAKKVIDYAYKFKGARYKYAGTSPKGFDCSGYVQY
ncbi:MAG: NlpC/P60 family protein, partial [Bacteroidales bacterium]|nr:NlpC/P60 family protein [Bacteroidales bacterium]